MAKVIVTCPDRHGLHPGFYSGVGFFPVGETEADLPDADLAKLEGEIARGESLLSVKRVEAKAEKGRR